ncbi:MAG: hypothetical protein ABIQ16_16040 [Polyangiaceae bacterium]
MAGMAGKVKKAGGGLTGLLVVGWSSAVAAQPSPTFALSWNGPPGCPSAENVHARVDTLLGGGARPSSVADVRASGQVERVDNGFRLLLAMGVGSVASSRVIEARSCDELAGAAAIAIALLARSTSDGVSAPPTSNDARPSSASDLDGNPPPASTPTPNTPSRKDAPPAEASSAEASSAAASSAAVHLVITAPIGVAGWGSLPSAGLGLGAGVGIRWKALRLTARGELWQPQTARVSGFATRFTLSSARADACLIQAVHGLELGPCIGAAAQRLAGEGVESEVFFAESRTAVWVSGTGGLFASLPTPGFANLRFLAAASVLISPSRPRFVIAQLGPVHEPALAATRLDLGCEWIF